MIDFSELLSSVVSVLPYRSSTKMERKFLLLSILLLLPSHYNCFLQNTNVRENLSLPLETSIAAKNSLHDLCDPDLMEMIVGGERYENVPLPDSMLETTIFVGNLCEFARDEDLSQKFRSVTNLNSLPACVARRPNSQSLEYGFVAFPTVEEKEVRYKRYASAHSLRNSNQKFFWL